MGMSVNAVAIKPLIKFNIQLTFEKFFYAFRIYKQEQTATANLWLPNQGHLGMEAWNKTRCAFCVPDIRFAKHLFCVIFLLDG